ncbi:hypothetical protein KP509_38G067900 [Ceratopteris richardii]|uniref:Uncharacterized protein n=1 Tax=Ceratopteris richardii TaxID=49495 RepID=A0A8T2Q4Y8_CERRI|nr:hypothetical protein KP509_38G067900 [Ceratopteris richardii]
MACHFYGLSSHLDKLEGNIVNMYRRSRKIDQPLMISMAQRSSGDFDSRAKSKLTRTVTRSQQEPLSSSSCLQQNTSNFSNTSNDIGLQSKDSSNQDTLQCRALAYLFEDKYSIEETVVPDFSCKFFEESKPCTPKSVEMQAFYTSTSNLSLLIDMQPNSTTNHNHAKLQLGIDPASDIVNDLHDGEAGEHEVEGATCLSSFTFGSVNHLLPGGADRSFFRQFSGASCISTLSLNCSDDHLSGDECFEPFFSGNPYLQAEMGGFPIRFPEVKVNFDYEHNLVNSCFQFEVLSKNKHFQMDSILGSDESTVQSTSPRLPPLVKWKDTAKSGSDKVSNRFQINKERLISANHATDSLSGNDGRQASLNLFECTELPDIKTSVHINGGADVARAFNFGIGIGVSYMLVANWKELNKLNALLERTESLVRDIQQQSPPSKVHAVEYFPSMGTSSHRERRSDALEAELAVMQQNLESEFHTAAEAYDQNVLAHELENKLSKSDGFEVFHSLAKHKESDANHVISPNTLKKRLHEVFEVQQEERMLHLEAQVEARELDLTIKERELQCWKDIAQHLLNALPPEPAGVEAYTIVKGESENKGALENLLK